MAKPRPPIFERLLQQLGVGLRVLLPIALSRVWKRVLIFAISLVIGFLGPVLALADLPQLKGPGGWFWDVLAQEANSHHDYKDIILAIIPLAVVCLTDFMNHALDDDFHFSDCRLIYLGLFTILGFIVVSMIMLPFSYASFASQNPGIGSWLSKFEYSWATVRMVIIAAFTFEIGLGSVEALCAARETLFSEERLKRDPARPIDQTSGP